MVFTPAFEAGWAKSSFTALPKSNRSSLSLTPFSIFRGLLASVVVDGVVVDGVVVDGIVGDAVVVDAVVVVVVAVVGDSVGPRRTTF